MAQRLRPRRTDLFRFDHSIPRPLVKRPRRHRRSLFTFSYTAPAIYVIFSQTSVSSRRLIFDSLSEPPRVIGWVLPPPSGDHHSRSDTTQTIAVRRRVTPRFFFLGTLGHGTKLRRMGQKLAIFHAWWDSGTRGFKLIKYNNKVSHQSVPLLRRMGHLGQKVQSAGFSLSMRRAGDKLKLALRTLPGQNTRR